MNQCERCAEQVGRRIKCIQCGTMICRQCAEWEPIFKAHTCISFEGLNNRPRVYCTSNQYRKRFNEWALYCRGLAILDEG